MPTAVQIAQAADVVLTPPSISLTLDRSPLKRGDNTPLDLADARSVRDVPTADQIGSGAGGVLAPPSISLTLDRSPLKRGDNTFLADFNSR